MLIGNRSVLHKSPFRKFSGTTLSGDRSNFGGNGALRDRFAGGMDVLSGGIPCGHTSPSSWSLPQKAGGISAFTTCAGAGECAIALAAGVGMAGPADGSAVVSADLVGVFGGQAVLAGASGASAIIFGSGSLNGVTAGYGLSGGDVFAAISIAGAADGAADAYATGILSVSSPGLSAGASDTVGALAALYSLAGAAFGEGSADVFAVGAYAMGGNANGVAMVFGGELVGGGNIDGSVLGLSSLVVNPYAPGLMSGSTAIAEGELTADAVAVAVWSYER